MRYKIRLELESPLLAGGSKIGGNYTKSLDYIPGAVLRAAYSKEILNRCRYFDIEKSDRGYWVEYRGKDGCNECKLKNFCMNFSDIKFKDLHPLGARPYPMTSRRCKYDASHPVVDELLPQIKRNIDSSSGLILKCPAPNCGQRIEKLRGFYVLDESGNIRDVDPAYMLITKNGINKYTKTAEDEILYSVDVVMDNMIFNGEDVDTYFVGELDIPFDIEEISRISTLRIGSGTTKGFGKCKATFSEMKVKAEKEEMDSRIRKFNDKAGNNGQVLYIPITLMSDAYIGFEKLLKKEKNSFEIPNEQFKKVYEKSIHEALGSNNMSVEFVIAENDVKRGYNMAGSDVKVRNAKIVTKRGSVILAGISKDEYDVEALLSLEKKGIGVNRMHGYGEVRVCDDFHIDFGM